MKVIDRVVLVISSIIIVILGAAVLASVPGADRDGSFSMAFYDTLRENKALTVAASVLVVLVVLYQVSLALRTDDERRPIVATTALGQVQISMAAVESIAKRVARSVNGVRDVDARAEGDASGEGVSIQLRLEVSADSSIPDVVEGIERELAATISATCGLPLKKVHTLVKSVGPESSKPSKVS